MTLKDMGKRGLVLLGCGRMGGALLEGWLAQGLALEAVHVIDPAPSDRVQSLARLGLSLNAPLPDAPGAIVLAVKPQIMTTALAGNTLPYGPDTLILSVAAGTPIAAYEAVFGADAAIVRAMPNTPAAVGRGISAIVGNAAAGPAMVRTATMLMAAVGEVVHLTAESELDAVTAVSGCGPAYVFHLIEAMAAAGAAHGLPPDLAMRLARATVTGAGELAHQASDSAAQLRQNVTSPGGVTAAALEVLMAPEGGLTQLMTRAMAAAIQRNQDLAGS
jgi:pyrroline-5-carboxylate reductase